MNWTEDEKWNYNYGINSEKVEEAGKNLKTEMNETRIEEIKF